MKPYQEEYLRILHSVSSAAPVPEEGQDPDAFVAANREENAARREAVAAGTKIIREKLFPVLGDIVAVPEEDVDSLFEFASHLMSGVSQSDVGLHYRIHLSLLGLARHLGRRDMLIRELYLVGMSLHNLETMLSPNNVRLYTTRMRLCFSEAASYFGTEYYDEADPETRGYIHRSMGNIALAYDTSDDGSAKEKLAVTTRSIEILSDPDIRAKTPSLPWDTYLYKSHQERTTLLAYLRSGNPGPEAFAKVLESAQIVQDRQFRAAKERGEQLQPRWQYAYMAARYHCGAMLLPEFLDRMYRLSFSRGDDDFGSQSMFSHVGAAAVYMDYSKHTSDERQTDKIAMRIRTMTRRMCSWIVRAPSNENNEQLMFFIRQFLYAYRELPGTMPFFELLGNVFAARNPTGYARMRVTGRVAEQLALWAVDDCPGALVGLPGCPDEQSVVSKREMIAELASRAGILHDAGMIHFVNLDVVACRELFEEEDMMIRLHTHCGSQLMNSHPSTMMFADVARGHHVRFDERGGYPTDFSPSASPVKQLIYLVSAANALVSSIEDFASRFEPYVPFDQACERIERGSGKTFAPFASALISSVSRREQLREELAVWQKDALLDMYRRRKEML